MKRINGLHNKIENLITTPTDKTNTLLEVMSKNIDFVFVYFLQESGVSITQ